MSLCTLEQANQHQHSMQAKISRRKKTYRPYCSMNWHHRRLSVQPNTTHIEGMTLIEIMIVVAILAILATFVVPNFLDRPDQARITKARQDIRALEAALQLYKLDNFSYPTTQQGINALVQKPESGGRLWRKYLDRLPKDPWENNYQYRNPGSRNSDSIDVFSFGADGQEGGDGINQDIGNWNLEEGTQNPNTG